MIKKKVGRPPKDEQLRRTRIFQLCLTENELAWYRDLAKAKGYLSVSAMIRDAVIRLL